MRLNLASFLLTFSPNYIFLISYTLRNLWVLLSCLPTISRVSVWRLVYFPLKFNKEVALNLRTEKFLAKCMTTKKNQRWKLVKMISNYVLEYKQPIFFLCGFLLRTFMLHRTAGKGRDYYFNSSLPLPPASDTYTLPR